MPANKCAQHEITLRVTPDMGILQPNTHRNSMPEHLSACGKVLLLLTACVAVMPSSVRIDTPEIESQKPQKLGVSAYACHVAHELIQHSTQLHCEQRNIQQ